MSMVFLFVSFRVAWFDFPNLSKSAQLQEAGCLAEISRISERWPASALCQQKVSEGGHPRSLPDGSSDRDLLTTVSR